MLVVKRTPFIASFDLRTEATTVFGESKSKLSIIGKIWFAIAMARVQAHDIEGD